VGRHSSFDECLTCGCLADACLHDLTHDDFVNQRRVKLDSLTDCFDGNATQRVSG
jgi:Fe-S oxidoreductase